MPSKERVCQTSEEGAIGASFEQMQSQLDKFKQAQTTMKAYKKRPKYFVDRTVAKVVALSGGIEAEVRKSPTSSQHVRTRAIKYQRTNSVEEELKSFISRLDEYELAEE